MYSYAALGLLPNIPISSSRQKLSSATGATAAFGRIVRDEEGNVVDIIIPEDDVPVQIEEGDEVEKSETVQRKCPFVLLLFLFLSALTEFLHVALGGKKEKLSGIGLEELSRSAAPVKRHSSTSEKTWLIDLVKKYGDDVDGMSRDKKMNVWQNTSGEIRRMIRKAGGVEKLRLRA